MQISDEQIRRILEESVLPEQIDDPSLHLRPADGALIARVINKINAMPDREDRIAELKARIESGEYNITGAEIAEAMIRRSIADKVR